MSFIENIRKLLKSKDKKQEFEEPEEISFEDLIFKLENKTKESSEKMNFLKFGIKNKISSFEKEITESTEILRKIDLSERKEKEKIKLINKENLNLYVSYLEKLIFKLKSLENSNIQEYIQKIFELLNEFNKSSHIPFEKATILVGKEMGEARDKIRTFAKDIEQIVKENKSLFETEKSISKIKELLEDFKRNASSNEEFDKILNNLNNKIEELKKEQKNIENKILEVKNSKEYFKDLKEEELFQEKVNNLEKEIHSIKEKMDLKALARIHHSDKKSLELIKEYSSNFKFALENDRDLKLGNLIEISNPEQVNSLKHLQTQIIQLKEPFITRTKEEILHLESKLKNSQYEVISLDESINNELKKKEKITIKKNNLMKEINELSKSLFPK